MISHPRVPDPILLEISRYARRMLDGEICTAVDAVRVPYLAPSGVIEAATPRRVIYRPARRSFRDRIRDQQEIAILLEHPGAAAWLVAWAGRAPAPPLGPMT